MASVQSYSLLIHCHIYENNKWELTFNGVITFKIKGFKAADLSTNQAGRWSNCCRKAGSKDFFFFKKCFCFFCTCLWMIRVMHTGLKEAVLYQHSSSRLLIWITDIKYKCPYFGYRFFLHCDHWARYWIVLYGAAERRKFNINLTFLIRQAAAFRMKHTEGDIVYTKQSPVHMSNFSSYC